MDRDSLQKHSAAAHCFSSLVLISVFGFSGRAEQAVFSEASLPHRELYSSAIRYFGVGGALLFQLKQRTLPGASEGQGVWGFGYSKASHAF